MNTSTNSSFDNVPGPRFAQYYQVPRLVNKLNLNSQWSSSTRESIGSFSPQSPCLPAARFGCPDSPPFRSTPSKKFRGSFSPQKLYHSDTTERLEPLEEGDELDQCNNYKQMYTGQVSHSRVAFHWEYKATVSFSTQLDNMAGGVVLNPLVTSTAGHGTPKTPNTPILGMPTPRKSQTVPIIPPSTPTAPKHSHSVPPGTPSGHAFHAPQFFTGSQRAKMAPSGIFRSIIVPAGRGKIGQRI